MRHPSAGALAPVAVSDFSLVSDVLSSYLASVRRPAALQQTLKKHFCCLSVHLSVCAGRGATSLCTKPLICSPQTFSPGIHTTATVVIIRVLLQLLLFCCISVCVSVCTFVFVSASVYTDQRLCKCPWVLFFFKLFVGMCTCDFRGNSHIRKNKITYLHLCCSSLFNSCFPGNFPLREISKNEPFMMI